MNIIQKIHNEIDFAEDKLLQMARQIIQSHVPNTKAERLKKIGFINVDIVKKNEKQKQILIKNREQAELIEYYKQNYPFQKFLTEEELERICKKYKLIFAPISHYIKDIPEKNLNEIEKLSILKNEDKANDITFTKIFYSSSFLSIGLSAIKAKRLGLPFRIDNFQETFFSRIDNHLRANYPQVSHRAYICEKGQVHTIKKQGLFICAPKSHFDLKGLKRKNKFSFMNITIIENKDPIVFRYCRGGIQILSKWGLENNNESLINEKMN